MTCVFSECLSVPYPPLCLLQCTYIYIYIHIHDIHIHIRIRVRVCVLSSLTCGDTSQSTPQLVGTLTSGDIFGVPTSKTEQKYLKLIY